MKYFTKYLFSKRALLVLMAVIFFGIAAHSAQASNIINFGENHSAQTSYAIGNDLYVLTTDEGGGGSDGDNIAVINLTTNVLEGYLNTGTTYYPNSFAIPVGDHLYVPGDDSGSGGNNMTVITDGTITNRITIPGAPVAGNLIGTNLYIVSGTDMYVIDVNPADVGTTYDTITDTVSVGSGTTSSTVVGSDIYITDSSGVTIFNTLNNSATVDAITVGSNPISSIVAGNNLYVVNADSSTVSVIDTDPSDPDYNTAFATISLPNLGLVGGVNGAPMVLVGTKLYIFYGNSELGSMDGYFSVVDTNPADTQTYNTVTSTTASVSVPTSALLANNGDIYVTSYWDNDTVAIDPGTNTIVATISSSGAMSQAHAGTLVGDNLYVASNYYNDENPGGITVIDTATNTVTLVPPPMLTSATIHDSTLILTYDESLNASSIPVPSDFGVGIGSASEQVSGVTVSGNMVTLTLSSPLPSGGPTVTVNYTPGSNSIEDSTDTEAVALVNQSVQDQYVLTYTADGYGTIDGQTSETQIVNSGSNGRGVNADPDSGYQFNGWSDNDSNTFREDDNVTNDVNVIAKFKAQVGPVVTNNSFTNVTQTTATVGGTISDTGGASISGAGVYYFLSSDFATILAGNASPNIATSSSGSLGVGSFSISLTGLTCNTAYDYIAFAKNTDRGLGINQQNGQPFPTMFTTLPCNSLAPASTAAIISSGPAVKICTDPKALNYQQSFGLSDPSTCTYAAGMTPLVSKSSTVTPSSSSSSVINSSVMVTMGRVLKMGMKGADVMALQTYLKTHGYALSIDGSFGPHTKLIVQAFQKANHLTPDGIVGVKTRTLMK